MKCNIKKKMKNVVKGMKVFVELKRERDEKNIQRIGPSLIEEVSALLTKENRFLNAFLRVLNNDVTNTTFSELLKHQFIININKCYFKFFLNLPPLFSKKGIFLEN